MADHQGRTSEGASAGMSASATVIRGQPSWTFLYIFAGFALTTEGTMASMIDVLPWWKREILFVAVAAVTFWLVLFNGRVQNRLLAWKGRYEERPR